MGHLGDKRAVKPLISKLKNVKKAEPLSDIIYALELLKDEQAIEPITHIYLNSSNPNIQFNAAQALATFGSDLGKEMLRENLTHPDAGIRMQAANALAKLER